MARVRTVGRWDSARADSSPAKRALVALTMLALVSSAGPSPAGDEDPSANPGLRAGVAPRARSKAAVNEDWPGFLGPRHNGHSGETRLRKSFPESGPPRVWSRARGHGYAAPAIAGGRLYHFHRVDDAEQLEALDAVTGRRLWSQSDPSTYSDRYGYSDGPRATPVVHAVRSDAAKGAGGDGSTAVISTRVVTLGVDGLLQSRRVEDGARVWRRDLKADFKLKQEFFGLATSPLLWRDRLIINIGAPGGPSVVALDAKTGETVWKSGKRWGASYATPLPVTLHGEPRVLVFAGGESRPPHGGLICLDPRDGAIDFEFPWRSRKFESVNASSPVLVPGPGVLISASYKTGGILLDIGKDFQPKERWRTKGFALHFNTAQYKDGVLYGFHGRHMRGATLAAFDARTGERLWEQQLDWQESRGEGAAKRVGTYSPFRGTLIQADGDFLGIGELGHLLWLRLNRQGPKILARARLFDAPECWTPPSLSHGLLYLTRNEPGRHEDRRLLCYDLRAGAKAD